MSILWLKEIDKNNLREAGMKAAYLADLYNNDFPVSNGFVVESDAFKEFINSHGLNTKIKILLDKIDGNDLNSLAGISESIKKIILREEISPGLKAEILEAYENLNVNSELHNAKIDVLNFIKSGRGNAIVSVRSSFVHDIPGAGENFLNILGNNNLINAVKNCWSSLYSIPNLLLNKDKLLDNNPGTGVLVQKMVDAKKSGIALSNNPMSRNDEILIEAGFGLGQIITKGEITPDTFIVDKKSKKVSEKIGMKSLKLIRDVNNNKTVRKKLFSDEQKKRVLDDWEVDEVVKLAEKIENFYNENFAIEFGFGKKLEVFHARPYKLPEIIEKNNLDGKILIEGKGASPNINSGIARKDIIVSESANLGILNKAFSSKGIAVNSGSVGSSIALLCRQLGIPFIIAENSTALLDNGLLVTLDGRTGKIYEGDARRVEVIG
ncbi:hypothetical protein HYT56_04235 [Candidatus Woesearchaeota archaeon]|nr:hypothetical protein [Candidatus Woesearchaeota archaeon]